MKKARYISGQVITAEQIEYVARKFSVTPDLVRDVRKAVGKSRRKIYLEILNRLDNTDWKYSKGDDGYKQYCLKFDKYRSIAWFNEEDIISITNPNQ